MAAEEAKKAEGTAGAQAEKQANCLGCGKPIKKLKRYYRDGKFYCGKKCWIKAKKDKGAKDEKA